jgi:hypothetical protein
MPSRPKDQGKKNQVKKSAKNRAPEKNEAAFEEIIQDLTKDFEYKKKILREKSIAEGKDFLTKDALKNNEIFLGKVQIAHNLLQVQLVDGRIVQVHTPGDAALHDYIKQTAQGTSQTPDLQPYVLIRFPKGNKCGETLALISEAPESNFVRFKLLEKAGILVPTEDIIELFEEEVNVEDL